MKIITERKLEIGDVVKVKIYNGKEYICMICHKPFDGPIRRTYAYFLIDLETGVSIVEFSNMPKLNREDGIKLIGKNKDIEVKLYVES